DAVEFREQLPFRAELLDDRLDHDVAVGEVCEVCRQREQADVEGVDLALLDHAREEVLDPTTCRFPQLEGNLAADRLEAGLDGELRDARAHRPQAHYSDLHAEEPRRGPSSVITRPAAPTSDNAPVRPTARARKPIAGPVTRAPV